MIKQIKIIIFSTIIYTVTFSVVLITDTSILADNSLAQKRLQFFGTYRTDPLRRTAAYEPFTTMGIAIGIYDTTGAAVLTWIRRAWIHRGLFTVRPSVIDSAPTVRLVRAISETLTTVLTYKSFTRVAMAGC